jgi:DNA modification methylase
MPRTKKAAVTPAAVEPAAEDMRIEYTPIPTILAWPRNPKKHDEKELDASIERFGFNDPPTLDEGTGHLVEGHGRIEALERRRQRGAAPPPRVRVNDDGVWLVPIVRGVKFRDEMEAEAYVVAHNRVGEGLWDNAILAEVLSAARQNSLEGIGYDSEEAERIIRGSQLNLFGEDQDDVIPEPPKVATVKPGELWVLGRHRILCGDSTEPSAIARLMDGARAQLLATDPPYGVAYGSASGPKVDYDPIANDENDGPRLQAFLERVFRAVTPHVDSNAAWYIWHAFATYEYFAAALRAAEVTIKQQIIWVKPSLVLGRNDFHWRHEPCVYGWSKERPPWYSDRKQTTVWEIGREKDGIHPTQKPVEIFTRPMSYHMREGEVCLEPFSGSGSQIVAAERTGRRCFALELDARYCDVAIERWERISGGKAKRA